MTSSLRHCWVGISSENGAHNYGNRLIEHCLRRILRLPSRELEVSAYLPLSAEQMEEVNSCDYVVWPGCTMIQRKEHPAIQQLQYAEPPTFCFGSAFFTRLPFPHPEYCRRLERPVGARDSFTHRRLAWYGIDSSFIGCPTAFSGNATTWKAPGQGPVVFCFGRYNMGPQLKVFEQVRREAPVKVVIQEKTQRQYCPDDTDIVEYDDVDRVIDTYASASVVVTGRLHAALPAIASGTPVVFAQLVHDSRITLLKDIGLKIHNPYSGDILPLTRRLMQGQISLSEEILAKVADLKERYLAFVENFKRRVSALG